MPDLFLLVEATGPDAYEATLGGGFMILLATVSWLIGKARASERYQEISTMLLGRATDASTLFSSTVQKVAALKDASDQDLAMLSSVELSKLQAKVNAKLDQ